MREELLQELLASWLETATVEDIASDADRVGLMRRVAKEVVPNAFISDIYRRVFLRDVWHENIAA